MGQKTCPKCYSDNPGENRYCGNCGAALSGYAIVPSYAQLPIPAQNRWQSLAQAPLVQAATVSLGALILRSVFAWLHRRSVRPRQSNLLPFSRRSLSKAFFEPGRDLTPRQPGPFRVITLAWWSIRVEGPGYDYEDDLEQFRR
jgi:hypothetical protein